MPAETIKDDSVCIDASLVLSLLLDEPGSDEVRRLLRDWLSGGISLISSSLLAAEVTSVIRNRVYFSKISKDAGNEAFGIFSLLPIKTIDVKELYRRAWELATNYNLPRTYDMLYLAVAEISDCQMWTADKRLVNSLKGKTPLIQYVGDY